MFSKTSGEEVGTADTDPELQEEIKRLKADLDAIEQQRLDGARWHSSDEVEAMMRSRMDGTVKKS